MPCSPEPTLLCAPGIVLNGLCAPIPSWYSLDSGVFARQYDSNAREVCTLPQDKTGQARASLGFVIIGPREVTF